MVDAEELQHAELARLEPDFGKVELKERSRPSRVTACGADSTGGTVRESGVDRLRIPSLQRCECCWGPCTVGFRKNQALLCLSVQAYFSQAQFLLFMLFTQ